MRVRAIALFMDPWFWAGAVRKFGLDGDQLEWRDEGRHFDEWEEIEDGWVAEWRDDGWVLLDPASLEPLAEIPEVLRWPYAEGRAWAGRLHGAVLDPND